MNDTSVGKRKKSVSKLQQPVGVTQRNIASQLSSLETMPCLQAIFQNLLSKQLESRLGTSIARLRFLFP